MAFGLSQSQLTEGLERSEQLFWFGGIGRFYEDLSQIQSRETGEDLVIAYYYSGMVEDGNSLREYLSSLSLEESR